jgi:DNA adenine methylase
VSARVRRNDPKPISTLKWVGGKRRLSKEIVSVFPESFSTYFEPFLGGASVYLEALPAKAKLSDLNGSLINYYLHLRDNPSKLMSACLNLEQAFNKLEDLAARKDFYLKVRAKFNSNLAKKDLVNAAQFLFLNRTAFNGMYRENSRGEFNVPFNNKENLKLFDKEQFLANSQALKSATLSVSDYRKAVSKAKFGDLVYFDPPYIPLSTTAAFVDYTKSSFGPSAQEELRDTAKELTERGVTVVLSNSYCETVKKLYKGFDLRPVEINRLIAADGKVRGKALEYLIVGRPHV